MDKQETIISCDYYGMKINNDKLRIEVNNNKIIFTLTTEISYYKYIKEYDYDEIVKELNLFEYKDINNIYNYLIKSEYTIIKDEKKIIINDKEIKLNEKLLTNDEIIKMIMDEIMNQNEKINELDNLENKRKSEIKLIYKVENGGQYKLFGDKFVENNKNNINLYVNGYKTCLINEYKLERGDNIIIINIINPIKNLENMFENCNQIENLAGLINLDIQYCNNFSNMFYGCSSLSDISTLEKWNVSNSNNF